MPHVETNWYANYFARKCLVFSYFLCIFNTDMCIGNWKDRLRDQFLGITLQLKSPSVLVNSLDRFELLTESMGTVKIQLHVLARNFEKYGCYL